MQADLGVGFRYYFMRPECGFGRNPILRFVFKPSIYKLAATTVTGGIILLVVGLLMQPP
jgi:hypothetical protein